MSIFSSIPRSVSIALGRLRRGVIICSWIIGLALFTQLVIWSLATFTELRYAEVVEEQPTEEAPLVVHAEPEPLIAGGRARERRQAALPNGAGAPLKQQTPEEPEEPARTPSELDARFAGIFDLSAGIGQTAMLMLMLIIAVTVMLAAASSVPAVDKTVSSFLWLLLVAVLVLPVGNAFALPWQNGALTTYEHMATQADLLYEQQQRRFAQTSQQTEQPTVNLLEYYLRFGLLPAACVVGITLVGVRFCASLDGTLPQREDSRLDPALEREAGNITPTSLHGGRSGSVLTRAIGHSGANSPHGPGGKPIPNARSVSPGEQPQRLI